MIHTTHVGTTNVLATIDILHPCLGGFVEEGDEEEQDVFELGEQVSQVNQAKDQL